MKYKDMIYFNSQAETYGSCLKIKRYFLISLFIIACSITPCTNWLIPFTKKLIKSDIKIRYGV